jgi:hypothetical protein
MVWYHGGGFSYSSSNTPRLDGTNLATHHDVVVVTVNQRLNIMGHLHLAELGGEAFAQSGNAGTLDMVAALQVNPEHELMLISSTGTLVRTPVGEISVVGRNTQGVRLIRLGEGERLTGIERIESLAEDAAAAAPGSESLPTGDSSTSGPVDTPTS